MFSERERDMQEELWRVEDEINSIQLANYNANGICDYLKDFVRASTDDLDFGERKLLIESLVNKVVIDKKKKVTVALQPPLSSLGVFIPLISQKRRKTQNGFFY